MRTLLLFLVLTLCAVVAWAQFENSLDRNDYGQLFQEWKAFYGKTYESPREEASRFRTFVNKIQRVRALNLDHNTNAHGLNPFSDLTSEEFSDRYLMKNHVAPKVNDSSMVLSVEDAVRLTNPRGLAPRMADGRIAEFRPTGWSPNSLYSWGFVVSAVKDQGQCGSCWAFSATEQIETNWALAHDNNLPPNLAVQQIVSCDPDFAPYGCNGGDPTMAYDYVQSAGGLETDSSYPYTASNGVCTDTGVKVVKISGWNLVGQGDEGAMFNFLSTGGPLSICLNADNLETYVGGGAILPASTCNPDAVDHCVQLTGWLTDGGGNVAAWLVRNSWGTWWGNQGYAYLEYGQNACNLNCEPSVVISG